jgi:hypothetical protein
MISFNEIQGRLPFLMLAPALFESAESVEKPHLIPILIRTSHDNSGHREEDSVFLAEAENFH